MESSVLKKWYWGSLLCLLLGAGVTAAEDFGTARLLPMSGTVRESQSTVELDQKASEMPKDAKCAYTVEATNSVYSQTVKLFPGVNRITTKTADGMTETLAKLDVQTPNLRVGLSWTGQNMDYALCVNENIRNNSRFSGEENVSIAQAEAGLYGISVRYAAPTGGTETVIGPLLLTIGDYTWNTHYDNSSGRMYAVVDGGVYLPMGGWPYSIISRPTGGDVSDNIWGVAYNFDNYIKINLYSDDIFVYFFANLTFTYTEEESLFLLNSSSSAGFWNGVDWEDLTINALSANLTQSFSTASSMVPLVGALQTATVTIYVDDRLIYADSRSVSALEGDGERVWNIGTVVLHSGEKAGGYAVDGRRLDVTEQGAFVGVSPQTDFEVTELSGANGTAPVYLGVGDAAQFFASGTLNVGTDCEQADMPIIECFTNSNDAVGTVDGLGVFVAKATGHTQISCAGYSGDPIDVYVLSADIAMDGDRDGEISFDGTNDTSYVFWVNDDCDIEKYNSDESQWQEDDASPTDSGGHRDCDDNVIGNKTTPGEGACLRDLEDFTRVHVRINAPDTEQNGITFALRFENVADGDPAVNIFQAVTNSTAYLTDTNTATDQIQNPRLLTVANGGSDQSLDMLTLKTDGTVSPFLLEGVNEGTGDLTLVVKKGDSEICRKSVRLKLHKISWFYNIYQVLATGERWEAQVDSNSIHLQSAGYQAATSEKLLFVHGWNMEAWEKKRWAETAFKRLWWQGYQGSVTLFDWPTLANYSGVMDVVTNMTHFDNSEYRAWQSANALASVMTELNDGGNLRVLAHSMGNVATGEALQKYGAHPLLPPVHTYIACQAALSAHYYDNTVAANNPCGYRVFDITFPGTPDIIGHAYTGDADSRPYLVENSAYVVNLQNWYNPDDWALDKWEMNNITKPDNLTGYRFRYEGAKDSYYEGVDHFFGGPNTDTTPLVVTDQTQRRMIFAYAMESRSKALGQTANGDFNNWNLKTAMGYDKQHYSHSREFRSDIISEHTFWETVFTTCGFQKAE